MTAYLTIAKWVGGVLGGLAIAYIFYIGIRPTYHPTPTTTQQAGNITNNYYSPRLSFGCIRFETMKDKIINATVSK
jgi:hypothetical protein